MHELTICLNILNTLEAHAQKNHVRHIKKLWLEVGELAGIELDALQFSFPIAAAKTIAKDAILEIITIAGQAWCKDCQVSVSIKTLFEPCPHCGQYGYQVIQGKELKILKMEVE